MRELPLTEWLNSPETQMLLRYLRQRKGHQLAIFLAGEEVPPIHQGRAVAYNEIENLLSKPADEVRKILEGN